MTPAMEVIYKKKFVMQVSNEMNMKVEEANKIEHETKEIQYVTEG